MKGYCFYYAGPLSLVTVGRSAPFFDRNLFCHSNLTSAATRWARAKECMQSFIRKNDVVWDFFKQHFFTLTFRNLKNFSHFLPKIYPFLPEKWQPRSPTPSFTGIVCSKKCFVLTQVREGISTRLGRTVAIKCINCKGAPQKYTEMLVPWQVEKLPCLRHENVIRVFEIFEVRKAYYIIMHIVVLTITAKILADNTFPCFQTFC